MATADRWTGITISNWLTQRSQLTQINSVAPASRSVALGVAESDTGLYLGQDGWDGVDAPSSDLPSFPATGGIGGQILAWRPNMRVFTLPIMRAPGVSRDPLDRIIYSGLPLLVRWHYPAGEDDRFFLGCYVGRELPVRKRQHGFRRHDIVFTSQWSFLVSLGLGQLSTGLLAVTDSPGQTMWGVQVSGVTAGQTVTVTWQGVECEVRAPATSFIFSPSPPFGQNVTGAPDAIKLYGQEGEGIVASTNRGTATKFYFRNWVSI